MVEIWRPVAGHEESYEVSDRGSVRSLDRTVMRSNGSPQRVAGRVLRGRSDQSGHLSVNLPGEQRLIHRLVLEAFVGPCPPGMEACHNDGDPANNSLGNLRWDTHLANMHDKVRHGYGINQHASKTSCKRGHALEGPNLSMQGGSRVCRACAHARVYAHRHGEAFDPAIADAHYSARQETHQ